MMTSNHRIDAAYFNKNVYRLILFHEYCQKNSSLKLDLKEPKIARKVFVDGLCRSSATSSTVINSFSDFMHNGLAAFAKKPLFKHSESFAAIYYAYRYYQRSKGMDDPNISHISQGQVETLFCHLFDIKIMLEVHNPAINRLLNLLRKSKENCEAVRNYFNEHPYSEKEYNELIKFLRLILVKQTPGVEYEIMLDSALSDPEPEFCDDEMQFLAKKKDLLNDEKLILKAKNAFPFLRKSCRKLIPVDPILVQDKREELKSRKNRVEKRKPNSSNQITVSSNHTKNDGLPLKRIKGNNVDNISKSVI